MKENKFSVLMSVYKKENPIYFDLAIQSILKQTVQPNEVVIVCDGNLTSSLYEIINKYKSRYPDLFVIVDYPDNKGLGKALNIGLNKCKHELIARMDTDDISREDRFEKQVLFMKEHPEISIVGSNIAEFEHDVNSIISYRIVPNDPDSLTKYAHKRNPFNHMTVMFRKSSVESVSGYQDMPLAEDYYLWIRLFVKGYKGSNINDFLVYARAGEKMIQRRSGLDYAKKINKLRFNMYKLGFINVAEFILYSMGHSLIAILPINFKKKLYLSLLHKTKI